ncbi:MAG: serpin family protein [Clostridiales bacterium]|nr:serpin family protein [Clostridiales bacterium]
MKKRVAALLIASVIMSMAAGCTGKKDTKNSSKKNKTGEDPVSEITLDVPTVKRENGKQAVFELSATGDKTMTEEELKKAYSEFIFGLMKNCAEDSKGENVLISSDSILFALEMAAAGADGDTLTQMMNTMVPGAANDQAFRFGVDRMNSLKNNSLQVANSVWLNEAKNDHVYEDYLDYVRQNFDAGVSVLPFDQSGIDTINQWVEEKTKNRIHDLINQLDTESLMVLVNAISFDGKWKTGYEDYQVRTDVFTNGKGERSTQTFLSSTESLYLSNSEAQGFLKEYDDGKYAFMTILPNDESIDINEFMADMTPDEYWEFWESMDGSADVYTMMPEFKAEYSVSLPGILQEMGMTDAFDSEKADFSNMAKTQPYITDVIHKTFIEVDRNGTKAAAATAVVVEDACAEPVVAREVICNRPYAYAIVDLETGLPVFLGTVEDVASAEKA